MDAPGGPRPRRCPLESLSRRGLPDLRLCLSRRDLPGHLDREAGRPGVLRKSRPPGLGVEAASGHGALMAELPEAWEAGRRPGGWGVAAEPGWIAPGLAEEFPGLSIASTSLESATGRSPEALKERLRT